MYPRRIAPAIAALTSSIIETASRSRRRIARRTTGPAAQLWPLVHEQRRRIIGLVTFGVLGCALYLVGPLIVRELVNGWERLDTFATAILAAAALAATVCATGAEAMADLLGGKLGDITGHELRARLRRRLARVVLWHWEDPEASGRAQAALLHIESVRAALVKTLPNLVWVVATMSLTVLSAVLFFDPRVLLLVVACLPFLVWLHRRTRRERTQAAADQAEALEALVKHGERWFEGRSAKLARSHAGDEAMVVEWAHGSSALARAGIRAVRASVVAACVSTSGIATLTMITWIAGRFFDLSIGDVVALTAMLSYLIQPMSNLFRELQDLAEVVPKLDKVRGQLALPLEPEGNPTPDLLGGDLVVRDLSVLYSEGPAALDRLTFTVGHRSRVALMGRSGDGKTTVVGQIVGHRPPPRRGSITLGGHDLESLDPRVRHAYFGHVPQHPPLFPGTLRYNLSPFGDTDDDVLLRALRRVGLEEWARARAGLNTKLGADDPVSGGQRQRIAVARELLAGKPFLILDEPTSALDIEAAANLAEELIKATEGLTVIVVTHSVQLAELIADEIVVIGKGRRLEHGTPAALRELNGRYAQLARLATGRA